MGGNGEMARRRESERDSRDGNRAGWEVERKGRVVGEVARLRWRINALILIIVLNNKSALVPRCGRRGLCADRPTIPSKTFRSRNRKKSAWNQGRVGRAMIVSGKR